MVEIPSYIGAYRAPIRGASLSCDGAGSPLALVEISQRREVDDSKHGKFVSLLRSIRSPMLGKSTCFSEARLLRWVPFFAYLWSVELCRWIVLPETMASEGIKLCNDELNSLIKYGMGCGAAWLEARSAN